jgi:diadenosine tetraphosphate (Ap4A) HIT family hydrolase
LRKIGEKQEHGNQDGIINWNNNYMGNKEICVFCTNPIIKGRKIVRNEYAWAFPTNIPIVPGHVLICPIRCVADFNDLTPEEVSAIFDLQKRLKKSLQKTFSTDGFYYA